MGQESGIRKDTCITEYDSIAKRTIYQYVDLMPDFFGGYDSLLSFVDKNLKIHIPTNLSSGKVYISLIVESDGNLTNPKIIRGIDNELDVEALRLINIMPKWKVGKCNGIAVPVRQIVPINFKQNKNKSP